MSIWSKFINNLKGIPNPDDYEGEKIFDYPFIRSDKGQILIDSAYEKTAYFRYLEERALKSNRKRQEQFKRNREMFKNISEAVDRWIKQYDEENFYWTSNDLIGFPDNEKDIMHNMQSYSLDKERNYKKIIGYDDFE